MNISLSSRVPRAKLLEQLAEVHGEWMIAGSLALKLKRYAANLLRLTGTFNRTRVEERRNPVITFKSCSVGSSLAYIHLLTGANVKRKAMCSGNQQLIAMGFAGMESWGRRPWTTRYARLEFWKDSSDGSFCDQAARINIVLKRYLSLPSYLFEYRFLYVI